MTVEQKIKKIVDSMEGVSYLFDNWQTANIRLDKIKLPAVLNLLPVSGTFNLGRQQLRDCPNFILASFYHCIIFCAIKIELGFIHECHHTVRAVS